MENTTTNRHLKQPFRVKHSFLAFLFIGAAYLIPMNCSLAQEVANNEATFKENTIHGGLGFAGIVATATLNYERILTQNFDRNIVATFVKVGFGSYAGVWLDSGQYTFVQFGFLTGKKANHLEVSAGPMIGIGGEIDLPIAFGVGYRHQKPGKPFLFRTGIAFPESLHFGMGLSF